MRLVSLPRVSLAHLPTPLDEARNLSAYLGGPRILIKRDDMTGLALGGNKTRKLEYLVADARESGATVLVTTGGYQSNHCRQTAAAARVAGMRCVLVLDSPDPNPLAQGNLLLDHILGAEIRLVQDRRERLPMMEQVARELRAAGDVPYLIPTGGSNPIGASAYVAAVFEIMEQLVEGGIDASRMYVTTSTSGGTHAGLAIGKVIAGAPFEIFGIAIEADSTAIDEVVRPLGNATAAFLGTDAHLAEHDLRIDDRFVGQGYGIPTDECLEAIRIAARTEGLLLDPVYTGKTMAGMIEHIRSGLVGPGETVIFLHTGGTPALFSQATRVMQGMRRETGRLPAS